MPATHPTARGRRAVAGPVLRRAVAGPVLRRPSCPGPVARRAGAVRGRR